MNKLFYKAVGLLVSLLGGMLAKAIFNKAWKLAAGEDEAPKSTDAGRGWHEVLTAAAMQGAILAVVRAALDRTAAVGTQKLTGTWPGEEAEPGQGQGGGRDKRRRGKKAEK